MKRFLLPLMLGCLIVTAFAFFGCTAQQSDKTAAATSNDISIPDTMLAISKGGGMYLLFDPSQPDTMGSAQMEIMSLHPTSTSQVDEPVKSPATKKSSVARESAVKPPWPPDTMRIIFKNVHLKAKAHK